MCRVEPQQLLSSHSFSQNSLGFYQMIYYGNPCTIHAGRLLNFYHRKNVFICRLWCMAF
uniref:Uncharacterized protein n=1 Tax=uncultured marine virus TaxID=186617 RepID=A0A0F7L1M6_9VIRU|nr:hypothetical protein [uncultured marine virus]